MGWADASGVIAAFVVAGIGIMTYSFYRKQHQLNGLVEAFKLLNDERHRKSRGDVYAVFDSFRKNQDLTVYASNEAVEMVRSDFDQMGSLIRIHTIYKKGFLEAYGETTYRCWSALKPHIERMWRGILCLVTLYGHSLQNHHNNRER